MSLSDIPLSELRGPSVAPGVKATLFMGSDKYGYKISRVGKSGRVAWLAPAPEHGQSKERRIYLDDRGRWRLSGDYHAFVEIGRAITEMDPSF